MKQMQELLNYEPGSSLFEERLEPSDGYTKASDATITAQKGFMTNFVKQEIANSAPMEESRSIAVFMLRPNCVFAERFLFLMRSI